MQEKIIPLDYRVLVELDPAEEKSKGGIFMPEQLKQRLEMAGTKARIISMGQMAFTDGDGVKYRDAPKEGDRVLIGKYSGQPPTPGDEDLRRICNDKDVIAVLR